MTYTLRYKDPNEELIHVRHFVAMSDLDALIKTIVNTNSLLLELMKKELQPISSWTVQSVREYIIMHADFEFELKNEDKNMYIKQFMFIPREEVQTVDW